MVLSYERLSQSPRVFQKLTGVTLSEFLATFQKLKSVYHWRRQERLSQRSRQRAIGGGRNCALGLEDQFLMTLIRLRLRLTGEALGLLFGVDKSTVSRNTRAILGCLRELGRTARSWPEPPRRGRGLEAALREYPELLAFTDATD